MIEQCLVLLFHLHNRQNSYFPCKEGKLILTDSDVLWVSKICLGGNERLVPFSQMFGFFSSPPSVAHPQQHGCHRTHLESDDRM